MNDSINIPMFSVVICTYNRAHLITRALDSLIRQKETDWECIVIDDASSDETPQVVRSYLPQWPIRYYRHSHRGCALSKNAGIKAARGAYITFLDSDDAYAPEHLQIRKKILQHRDIDLLHSNVTIIGDPFVPDKEDPENKVHINDCIVGGTFFIKKKSLSPDNRFQDTFSDDSLFFAQFRKEGKKIIKIDAPTYFYYRDNTDSLCNATD